MLSLKTSNVHITACQEVQVICKWFPFHILDGPPLSKPFFPITWTQNSRNYFFGFAIRNLNQKQFQLQIYDFLPKPLFQINLFIDKPFEISLTPWNFSYQLIFLENASFKWVFPFPNTLTNIIFIFYSFVNFNYIDRTSTNKDFLILWRLLLKY